MLPVVPCLSILSDYEYPNEPQGSDGFREFPLRNGLKTNDLVSRGLPDTRICAFLQSWLFFGLLRETFARPSYGFDRSDFVKTTNTREQVITTEALPRYVWYWMAARTHDYREEVVELEKVIDSCLRQAHEILSGISKQMRRQHQHTESKPKWTVRPSIILSLSLLGDYLTFARHNIRQYTIAPTLDWECVFLDDMMIAAGWCIGEVSTLRKSCNLSSRYYLSTMDRKRLGKTHDTCISGLRCQAHQLDYNTYRTQHQANCPDLKKCGEVGPQVEEVTSAISAGGSAVILLRQPSNAGCKPEVIQVGGFNGSQIPYVAISHVWSDGRGNPWRNCLCSCQLQYIQNLVNALYAPESLPVPFWMDTLSIPVGQKYSGLRQMAIAGIAKTFKEAEKVLVIDSALQLCGEEYPWIEILMRIQYSPWMTRLWTYLEGRLAKRLYFQLKDTAMSAEDLERKLVQQTKLISVSQSLQVLPEDKIRFCTSAIHLIRAIGNVNSEGIAQYARMSPQTDPEMEIYRQEAIQRLESDKDYYRLRDEWRPFLESIDRWNDLDEEDDRVRTDLEAQNICPVTGHAFNSIASISGQASGLYYRELNGLPHLDGIGMGTSQLFHEVSSGLRARTTSRMDDETICLAALLGVDLNEIQQIKTLHWRWRELLDTLDHHKSRRPLVRSLRMNFSRWTDACHVERMKVLLGKVREFKSSIIFWNVPRLGSKTWSWAPRSLLHKDLDSGLSWTGDAVLRCGGLECPLRAYKLGIQSSQFASMRETNESHRWINIKGATKRKVSSVIYQLGETRIQSRKDATLGKARLNMHKVRRLLITY